ncbi:MAG TPA: CHAD domain-containing protein [Thermoanaerobaculia bacterium]|nr:CHAD domain-containing protein [Thermoanaerobaculia bacterium]
MAGPGELWRTKRRSLTAARKALRAGDPEGLHDLRVALRRITATATALGHGKLARRSRGLVRSLSELRRLEVERQLLSRVRELSLFSSEAAAGLEARWDTLLREGNKEALRAADGRKIGKLLRRLSLLSRREVPDVLPKLREGRRRAERSFVFLGQEPSDRDLHRYRLAVKRARYLAEDLVRAGEDGLEEAIAHQKEIQDTLGRWNDTRLFRQRLLEERSGAESRGAVTLALELDRIIRMLERTVASARREALEAVRRGEVLLTGRQMA